MSAAKEAVAKAAHEWRARIDDSALSPTAQCEFDQWMENPVHAAAYAEAEIVWRALGSIEYDAVIDRPLRDENLPDNRGTHGLAWLWNALLSPRGRRAGAVATACVLALSIYVVFNSLGEHATPVSPEAFRTLTTARGETRSFTLSDGSELLLGPLSQVDVAISKDERRARLLAGDAYFDVASNLGSPFSVTVGAARVDVTGTAFDLRRRENRLTVAVAEGEVRVSHPRVIQASGSDDSSGEWKRGGSGLLESVTLLPGQTVVAAQGAGLEAVVEVAIADVATWRRGQLVYENARLHEVIADLNRYATFTISLEAPARELALSGTFSADEPELLLDALQAALPLQILDAPDGKHISLKEPPEKEPPE